jgi:hypothetical protein
VADAMLEETEQILMDYIGLLNKKGLAAAKPTARSARPD